VWKRAKEFFMKNKQFFAKTNVVLAGMLAAALAFGLTVWVVRTAMERDQLEIPIQRQL
jgi:hypothetical protein